MGGLQKLVAVAVAQVATIAAQLGVNMDWATPEVISSIGGVITLVLLYFVPDKRR